MKTLVVGGTGTVGGRVTKRLSLENEIELAIGSRREPRVAANVAHVQLDLTDPASVREAVGGFRKVVFISPASPSESEDGVRFVQVAARAGIHHIVFMSIHDVRKNPRIPHFKAKIDIQNAIEASGMKWTTIAPNNFFQNDDWFKEAILNHGIYPQPFGDAGLSRVDADDIADAIVNAVLDESLVGREFPLVGPQALGARQTARIYSERLGREIRYIGDDLDSWATDARKSLPAWIVEDWKEMYGFFQKEGLRASAEDLIKQARILNRAPKCFETYVEEVTQTWKQLKEERL